MRVKPGLALPAGHTHCKLPLKGSLPPGWHWCRSEQRIVTDAGVMLPLVDDPLVGTDEQREALRFFRVWEVSKRKKRRAS
jgi:hypothetical protein